MAFVGVEIAFLGSSSVSSKNGVVMWEPNVPNTDDTVDVEAFGPTAVYQALGVTSAPYPKDANGYAECLVVRHVGGRNAVCVGGRDTRTASVVGNLKPGDTVVHSTGPNQAAQLQLKEGKLQAVLVTKTKGGGKTMAVILDGQNEKIQVTHAGAIFEIDKNGDVSLLNSAGCGLLIQGSNVHIVGTPVLGAGNPPGLAFMLGPATGSPGGGAAAPMFAATGVAPGT